MTELRAAGQLKRHVFPLAAQPHVQRRSRFDNLRNLAQVFQITICTRDSGTAVFTDDDNRLSAFEFDLRSA